MENKRIARFAEAVRTRLLPAEESASIPGVLVREMIAMVGHHMGKGVRQFLPLPELEWRVPLGYDHVVERLDRAALEWLHNAHVGKGGKIIYQLHGGAYITPLTNQYRNNAVRLSKLAGDIPVATLNYRTAPEYVYPAALEDALEGFDALLGKGYKAEDILLFGDSAGGNLCLALTLELRKRGRALPGALVLLSPWTDLASRGESYKENLYKDPMFGIDEGQDPEDAGVTTIYAGNTPLDTPELSPAYATFENFPPMLLQVGSYEMLLSDSVTVAKRAKEVGVNATLTIYEGMFHVFSICCGDLIPESRAAWEEVGQFFAQAVKA